MRVERKDAKIEDMAEGAAATRDVLFGVAGVGRVDAFRLTRQRQIALQRAVAAR